MSIRAVGWLGSKLGLNIGGRGADDDGSGRPDGFGKEELAGFSSAENRSSSADPISATSGNNNGVDMSNDDATLANVASQWEATLGKVWKQTSEKATQFWNTNVRSGSGNNNDPFGFGPAGSQGGNHAAGDAPELDENGLPVTKNWYYYDAQLGRWTVSADAPQSVQREYYEKLEEAERERLGQKTVVAPPPPPPPGMAQRPLPPGATLGGGAPPPPPGSKGAQGGLFGPGGARGGHGPQYALPDYFGNSNGTSAPPASMAQAYPAAQQQQQQPLPPTMHSNASSGYATHSPYNGTPANAPIRSSPYAASLHTNSQSQQLPPPPMRSPPPPTTQGMPGMVPSPYGPVAAYPPAAAPVAAYGQGGNPYQPSTPPLSPPLVTGGMTSALPPSRTSPSPASSALYGGGAHPPPHVYPPPATTGAPGSTGGLTMTPPTAPPIPVPPRQPSQSQHQQQQQSLPPPPLAHAYPPPQQSAYPPPSLPSLTATTTMTNTYNNGGGATFGSPFNGEGPNRRASPPVQPAMVNHYAASGSPTGQVHSGGSTQSQGSLVTSPYASAAPSGGYTAQPAHHFAPAQPQLSSPSAPATLAAGAAASNPYAQQLQQQPAKTPSPAMAPPPLPQHAPLLQTADYGAAPPTQSTAPPPPAPPQSSPYPSSAAPAYAPAAGIAASTVPGAAAAPTARPAAANMGLPPPPSFKPFSPS